MAYESSATRSGAAEGPAYDTRTEQVTSEQASHAESNGREQARNWAWAHSHESYDWMDSHSPSTTLDSFH
jgi:hypothetical protein